jgi:hypothetical protein
MSWSSEAFPTQVVDFDYFTALVLLESGPRYVAESSGISESEILPYDMLPENFRANELPFIRELMVYLQAKCKGCTPVMVGGTVLDLVKGTFDPNNNQDRDIIVFEVSRRRFKNVWVNREGIAKRNEFIRSHPEIRNIEIKASGTFTGGKTFPGAINVKIDIGTGHIIDLLVACSSDTRSEKITADKGLKALVNPVGLVFHKEGYNFLPPYGEGLLKAISQGLVELPLTDAIAEERKSIEDREVSPVVEAVRDIFKIIYYIVNYPDKVTISRRYTLAAIRGWCYRYQFYHFGSFEEVKAVDRTFTSRLDALFERSQDKHMVYHTLIVMGVFSALLPVSWALAANNYLEVEEYMKVNGYSARNLGIAMRQVCERSDFELPYIPMEMLKDYPHPLWAIREFSRSGVIPLDWWGSVGENMLVLEMFSKARYLTIPYDPAMEGDLSLSARRDVSLEEILKYRRQMQLGSAYTSPERELLRRAVDCLFERVIPCLGVYVLHEREVNLMKSRLHDILDKGPYALEEFVRNLFIQILVTSSLDTLFDTLYYDVEKAVSENLTRFRDILSRNTVFSKLLGYSQTREITERQMLRIIRSLTYNLWLRGKSGLSVRLGGRNLYTDIGIQTIG